MLSSIAKSIILELNHLKKNKLTLISLIVMPLLLITMFASLTNTEFSQIGAGVRFYDFYAPLLFSVVILFACTQLTVLRIVGERTPYGTLDRDLLAISRVGMYLGKFIANAIIGLILSVLVYFFAVIVFPVKITGDPLALFLSLFLISLIGVSLGLFFSVISKSKSLAIQLVPYVILVLFILSGMLVPLDNMPKALMEITAHSPLNVSGKIMQLTIFSQDYGLERALSNLHELVIWIILLLGIGLTKFELEKPNLNKKDLLTTLAFFVVMLVSLSSYFWIAPLSWEKMRIQDFKAYEIQSPLGNVAQVKNLTEDYKEFSDITKDIESYDWIISNKTIAKAVIIEFENKNILTQFESNPSTIIGNPIVQELLRQHGLEEASQKIEKTSILKETVYTYSGKIKENQKTMDITVYAFGENRFLFIIGGEQQFAKNIAEQIIKKYP